MCVTGQSKCLWELGAFPWKQEEGQVVLPSHPPSGTLPRRSWQRSRRIRHALSLFLSLSLAHSYISLFLSLSLTHSYISLSLTHSYTSLFLSLASPHLYTAPLQYRDISLFPTSDSLYLL